MQMMESQVGDFYKDVGQPGGFQTVCLAEPRMGEVEAQGEELEARVETRIVRLIEPLKERRRILLASKEMHQVSQDLEDEMVRLTAVILVRFSVFTHVDMSECSSFLWIPPMLN